MVEQFGLAIITPERPLGRRCPFTSGTQSSLSGSMRKAAELSMTTAPARAATGAHSFEISSPEEKKTTSSPSNPAGVCTSTATVRRWQVRVWPLERSEAKSFRFPSGKRRSSRRRRKSSPTKPVAPTTPTLSFLLILIHFFFEQIFVRFRSERLGVARMTAAQTPNPEDGAEGSITQEQNK